MYGNVMNYYYYCCCLHCNSNDDSLIYHLERHERGAVMCVCLYEQIIAFKFLIQTMFFWDVEHSVPTEKLKSYCCVFNRQ